MKRLALLLALSRASTARLEVWKVLPSTAIAYRCSGVEYVLKELVRAEENRVPPAYDCDFLARIGFRP